MGPKGQLERFYPDIDPALATELDSFSIVWTFALFLIYCIYVLLLGLFTQLAFLVIIMRCF